MSLHCEVEGRKYTGSIQEDGGEHFRAIAIFERWLPNMPRYTGSTMLIAMAGELDRRAPVAQARTIKTTQPGRRLAIWPSTQAP
jgi:hypothetical protein